MDFYTIYNRFSHMVSSTGSKALVHDTRFYIIATLTSGITWLRALLLKVLRSISPALGPPLRWAGEDGGQVDLGTDNGSSRIHV